MASEYLKQKYKDVKPDAPRELTKEEQRKNWWHYNKGYVIGGVILVLILADLVWSFLGRGKPQPDCQIAYVGSTSLPDDTVSALEAGFAGLCEDLNGDGKVIVTLRQYVSHSKAPASDETASDEASPDGAFPDEASSEEASSDELSPDEPSLTEDPSTIMATTVQLIADITEQESFLFLLEDPESFQEDFHALCHLDGTLPEEEDYSVEDSVLLWSQCPVLTEMDLGDFSYDLLGADFSGNSQELVSKLYIGRRGFWKEPETNAGLAALWDKVTAGAVS